jgi:hypothetical protein
MQTLLGQAELETTQRYAESSLEKLWESNQQALVRETDALCASSGRMRILNRSMERAINGGERGPALQNATSTCFAAMLPAIAIGAGARRGLHPP